MLKRTDHCRVLLKMLSHVCLKQSKVLEEQRWIALNNS